MLLISPSSAMPVVLAAHETVTRLTRNARSSYRSPREVRASPRTGSVEHPDIDIRHVCATRDLPDVTSGLPASDAARSLGTIRG
jgi:hypothetical protein